MFRASTLASGHKPGLMPASGCRIGVGVGLVRLWLLETGAGGLDWTRISSLAKPRTGRRHRAATELCGRNGEGKVERVMGIEPTLAAWEAAVLPLNYTRVPVRIV